MENLQIYSNIHIMKNINLTVKMLKEGCLADTPYLIPPDSDYDDFEDGVRGAIKSESHYTNWNELDKEDIGEWIKTLEDLLAENHSSFF